VHLLAEMSAEVDALAARLGRPLTLIAESDLNDPVMVTPRAAGGYGLDGQWSDDFHHALHVALTGETHGYYADFEPLAALAKVCERGFFHDGTWSSFREREHGAPIDPKVVPPWRLVVCSQNHDQVGNRAAGDRLTAALDDDQLACAALVTMCSPFTPMLFQGEEWAASTPFQFFTSHTDPEIGRATSEGRHEEFARHGWDADVVPDPQDVATYERSKLDWSERSAPRGERMLATYRRLTELRREHADLTAPAYAVCTADEATRVFTMRRGGLMVLVNFGEQEQAVAVDATEALFETGSGVALAVGSVALPPHAGALLRVASR
jgi:maltooligosyltrehalose trehalohydrolase